MRYILGTKLCSALTVLGIRFAYGARFVLPVAPLYSTPSPMEKFVRILFGNGRGCSD